MEDQKLKIKAREVVVSKEAEDSAFCDVFVYEPENIAEQELGNLYIVGEVSNLTDNSSYLINLLASTIKKEFYSNTKKSPLEGLEAGLHKANVTLAEFAEQGNVDWMGNLHMICAVLKDSELHLSKVGKAKTLLLRDSQSTDIGQNLLGNEQLDPLKTFANIASGALEKNDTLILSTPKVFEAFSLEKMEEALMKMNLDEFAAFIQESIEDDEKINTVGLLVIKAEENGKEKLSHSEINVFAERKEPKVATPLFYEKPKEKDLKTLLEEEEIISMDDQKQESFFGGGKKEKLGKSISVKQKIIIFTRSAGKKTLNIFKRALNKIFHFLKTETFPLFVILGKKTLRKLGETLSGAKNSGSGFIRQASDRESRAGLFQTVKNKLNSKKIIWVVVSVLVILLAADLALVKQQKNKKAEFEHYNELLVLASQKENEAEQAIIYQDLNRAKELLREAGNLSSQVVVFQDLKNEALELRQKISDHSDQVDHINRIDNPKLAIDFNRIGSEAEASGLVKLNDKFYSFNFENNNIYQLSPTENSASRILVDSDSLGRFKAAVSLDRINEIIFVTDTPSMAIYNADKNNLKKGEISFVSDKPEIRDIGSFGANIYLLDAENSQIYKYERSLNGFKSGKEWIVNDENVDLKNAVSLAIDGSVFILRSDGAVEKYLRGIKKEFELSYLIEPLNNPIKVYTESDFDYLYVLDQQNKRVVQYNKINGELVSQYTSESFDNLKDVVIDDQEEKMYLLNGKKIFEVEILK